MGNLKHMSRFHSFFIPDIEYLKDVEGLMKHLCDKVAIGKICLYCNGRGKTFHSLEAIQAHMRDMGHCKLRYDENEDCPDYDDYYDFSATYVIDSEGNSTENMENNESEND